LSRRVIEDHTYALLRMVAGFLFMFHGLQKIFGLFGGRVAELMSLRGLAGIMEIAGGPLIMIGLWTSPVAFLCSGEMAIAYFRSHQPRGVWPIQNGGELAALYCFVFLFIAFRGAGPLSVDRLWKGRRK
jgi:putative oxidoreductase